MINWNLLNKHEKIVKNGNHEDWENYVGDMYCGPITNHQKFTKIIPFHVDEEVYYQKELIFPSFNLQHININFIKRKIPHVPRYQNVLRRRYWF